MKKNWPWIVGTLGAIVWFGVFEKLAFDHPNSLNTLSRFIATIGATWPLSIFLMGLFVGILAAHLFWKWSENPIGGDGG